MPRPDICIDTDRFHTPEWLQHVAVQAFEEQGWRVAANRPYAGSIVPLRFYQREKHVLSIMVEVSRARYLDEGTGERLQRFAAVQRQVRSALEKIAATFAPTGFVP